MANNGKLGSVKSEKVIEFYKLNYDKNYAYTQAGLNDRDIERANADEELQVRIKFFSVKKHSELVGRLSGLSESKDDKIALAATMQLGKILFPETFNVEKKIKSKHTFPDNDSDSSNDEEEREHLIKQYSLMGIKKIK